MRKILVELTVDFPGEEKIPYQELEDMMNEALKSPPAHDGEEEDKSYVKFLRVTFNTSKKKKKKKRVHLPQQPA